MTHPHHHHHGCYLPCTSGTANVPHPLPPTCATWTPQDCNHTTPSAPTLQPHMVANNDSSTNSLTPCSPPCPISCVATPGTWHCPANCANHPPTATTAPPNSCIVGDHHTPSAPSLQPNMLDDTCTGCTGDDTFTSEPSAYLAPCTTTPSTRRSAASHQPPNNAQLISPPLPVDLATHITITTYNVVLACSIRLLEALHVMANLNTDIVLLMEAKLICR